MRENPLFKVLGLLLILAGVKVLLMAPETVVTWQWQAWRATGQFALWASAACALMGLGLWCLVLGCGGLAPRVDHRRRGALKWQLLLWLLALPLAVMMVLENYTADGPAQSEVAVDVMGTVLLLLLTFLGLHLWRRILQHEAATARELLAADERAPVLYLRSFKDDTAPLMTPNVGTPWERFARWFSVATPEQELAALLREYGPVVAIGKPGEALPELGAARLYVGHDEWQATVQGLMHQAALVVIRVGTSPGVVWEIEQALANVPRQHLVLALMGVSALPPEVAQPLQPVLGPILQQSLAAPEARRWWQGWGANPRRLGGLIGFDAQGRAHAFALRNQPDSLQNFWRFMALAALRPSFGPLRQAWGGLLPLIQRQLPARRRRPSRALAMVLAIWFGYAGAHWLYLGRPRTHLWKLVLLFPFSLLMGWWDAWRMLWMTAPEFQHHYGVAWPTKETS